MSATCLYAVLAADAPITLSTGGAGPQARVIVEDGLGLVVGEAPPVDLRNLPRQEAVHHLLAHQRVIEAAMAHAPVLPVKFGTVIADARTLRHLLAREGDLLRARLKAFADRIQMEIVVIWDIERVFKEIGSEPDIAALKADAAPQEGEAARIRLGQAVKRRLDERRRAIHETVLRALRGCALDSVANPLMDDRMAVNLAILIDRARTEDLDTCLQALDEETQGALTIRCVGPLPPSSFATVEVDLPCYEEIDRARRTLQLGQRADAREIAASYRRLARAAHPALGADRADGAARMGELSDAYKLLSAYAHRQGGDPARAADGTQCSFDPDAVSRSVFVDIVRQEPQAQSAAA